MKSTYEVRAVKWSGGWELHVANEGVTQVRTLDKAESQVRDYLSTLRDRDMSNARVIVTPELDGLEEDVRVIKAASIEAARAQVKAAADQRSVVKKLRAKGLSVTDTAVVMGVSRGRVSQLTEK